MNNSKLDSYIALYSNSEKLYKEARLRFAESTSILNKKDLMFIALACALNVESKFLIRKMRAMKDSELAKLNPLHNSEHSNRLNNEYYASLEEIIHCPVPFDAIQKQYSNDWYKINNQEKPNFSGFNHRATALGHDIILGLIFGTANIMTSTITRNDFRSWHVNTIGHERTKRGGKIAIESLDTICKPASTPMIFQSVINRLENEGKQGWIALGTALAKEVIHLLTDIPSTTSLCLPIVPIFSEKLARELSLYGINSGTLLQGTIHTKIINFIIALFHRWFKEDSEDETLYSIRTKKIVAFSNMFASHGDLALTLYQLFNGQLMALRKFDLGGYLMTLKNFSELQDFKAQLEISYMQLCFQEELNKIRLDKQHNWR